MKVLLVGVGTVGEAIARLSAGRPWLEKLVLADYDLERARRVADQVGDAGQPPGRAGRCLRRQPRSRRWHAPTTSTS